MRTNAFTRSICFVVSAFIGRRGEKENNDNRNNNEEKPKPEDGTLGAHFTADNPVAALFAQFPPNDPSWKLGKHNDDSVSDRTVNSDFSNMTIINLSNGSTASCKHGTKQSSVEAEQGEMQEALSK